MVTDLFSQYFQHTQNSQDDPDESQSDDAATAREIFETLFANHPEFADEESAEAFLSTAKSPNDPRVLSKLTRWCNDILDQFVSDRDLILTLGSKTIEDLVEQFIPFTRKMPYASYGGKPLLFSPWPFVRLVR